MKRRKIYYILSFVFIVLDVLTFCSMEILDICFTYKSQEGYEQKMDLFILKVKSFYIKDRINDYFRGYTNAHIGAKIFEFIANKCNCLFHYRDYFILLSPN